MRSRTIRLAMIAVLILAIAVAPGCKSRKQTIVSAWPRADAERTVPRPADELRWQLTGLDAPSADVLKRRAVSVKIENSSASRPQMNLQGADVVYETITEGGITRFNAIFHSKRPEVVGPVRSARLSDTDIVPQYNALFFFSGASNFVHREIRKRTKIENLSQDAGVSAPYFRARDRSAPHNLFLQMDRVDEAARKAGFKLTQQLRGFAFDRSGDTTGQATSEVYIPFSPAAQSTWRYDESSKRWLRYQNGSKHMDRGTGEQISARNVVVMWAKLKSTGHRDVVGSDTFEIELTGSNRVTVFRDGMRFTGKWSAGKDSPPKFTADDGTPLLLSPGNTWFQVVPTNVNVKLK